MKPNASTPLSSARNSGMVMPSPPLQAQDGDQHQQGNHREVLKQKDAERQSAMSGLHLELLGQLADYDCRRRHGQQSAHDDCRTQRQSDPLGNDRPRRRGYQDLRTSEPEQRPAHGQQLGQGKFHTDGEQQEHHTDLREEFDRMGILDPSQWHIGTHDDTDDQVRQYRRQAEAPEQHHHYHGG